jgi:hypothetical protein
MTQRGSGRPPGPGTAFTLTPLDWLAGELGCATHGRKRDRPSEFSAGPGLTAPGCEDKPPSEGGRYRGRTMGSYARTYEGRHMAD